MTDQTFTDQRTPRRDEPPSSTVALDPGHTDPNPVLASPAARTRVKGEGIARFWWLVPTLYIVLLMLPIYWLVNMSFKTNREILGAFSLWPRAGPRCRRERGSGSNGPDRARRWWRAARRGGACGAR